MAKGAIPVFVRHVLSILLIDLAKLFIIRFFKEHFVPEGAHKHFFDRDACPKTNFNYPKK